MKLKSKLMMAVMAVVFLAAGSAWAIPTVDYTVNGNVLNFSVYNDLTDFGISKVGFYTGAISDSWEIPLGVQYYASNGYDWFDVNPYVYGVDSIANIKITVSSVPSTIDYILYIKGEGILANATFVNIENGLNKYKLTGNATANVPEPATILMLVFGLLGMVGLRKKICK